MSTDIISRGTLLPEETFTSKAEEYLRAVGLNRKYIYGRIKKALNAMLRGTDDEPDHRVRLDAAKLCLQALGDITREGENKGGPIRLTLSLADLLEMQKAYRDMRVIRFNEGPTGLIEDAEVL